MLSGVQVIVGLKVRVWLDLMRQRREEFGLGVSNDCNAWTQKHKKNLYKTNNSVKSVPMLRTHARLHARTHARTHAHTKVLLYLSIRASICPSVRPSIRLSVRPSVHPSDVCIFNSK